MQEQIKGVLGADGLLYQTHADLIAVGHGLNPSISRFEDSCFTGALMGAMHVVHILPLHPLHCCSIVHLHCHSVHHTPC